MVRSFSINGLRTERKRKKGWKFWTKVRSKRNRARDGQVTSEIRDKWVTIVLCITQFFTKKIDIFYNLQRRLFERGMTGISWQWSLSCFLVYFSPEFALFLFTNFVINTSPIVSIYFLFIFIILIIYNTLNFILY